MLPKQVLSSLMARLLSVLNTEHKSNKAVDRVTHDSRLYAFANRKEIETVHKKRTLELFTINY